jgi:hypothetical protein
MHHAAGRRRHVVMMSRVHPEHHKTHLSEKAQRRGARPSAAYIQPKQRRQIAPKYSGGSRIKSQQNCFHGTAIAYLLRIKMSSSDSRKP